jgi:transposase
VRFLMQLMRQIPFKVLVIWDGSPIHRSRAVKDFLRSGAARRVQLEQLPVYAPDLNPDEGIYKHLKCGVEEPLLPEPFRVEGRTAQG